MNTAYDIPKRFEIRYGRMTLIESYPWGERAVLKALCGQSKHVFRLCEDTGTEYMKNGEPEKFYTVVVGTTDFIMDSREHAEAYYKDLIAAYQKHVIRRTEK